GLVLVHSHQRRHAATLAVGAAYGMAWSFWSNHDDVNVSAWLNLTVVHVEAMSKRQCSAGLQVSFNLIAIDIGDIFVGQQNHYQVGVFNGVSHFSDFKAGVFGFAPGGAAFTQAHHHINT